VPGFHPWSSAYGLAEAAHDASWPRKIAFNSSELAALYAAPGHQVDDSLVFEPVMNGQLLDGLRAGPQEAKQRDILFYGRPADRRNCYHIGKTALEIWSRSYQGARAWRVVSVGQPHDVFPLPGGQDVVVRGKLTLDEYVSALHRSAVGLSRMASPHPSYPPLDMAHLGLVTVTNTFAQKVPDRWHDNIRTPTTGAPEDVADALVQACRAFDADAEAGPPRAVQDAPLSPAAFGTGPWHPWCDDDLQLRRRCQGLMASRGCCDVQRAAREPGADHGLTPRHEIPNHCAA
jgi:hypothetical protein